MSNFVNVGTGGGDLSGLAAVGAPPQTMGAAPGNGPVDAFSEYFGPPSRPIQVNPYELFSRQNLTLPEAYVGRNDYLVNIIITTIKEEEMWAGRIALPFRIADSQYEIQWDEIHFDNQLLGPVPEEGVSRLVTQRTSSRKDHYVRYGLAFQLEHGFMKTERGKMSYVNNLKQIRNATLDTIYLGVLRAYLQCKSYGQALVEMYGTNPSHAQIRRVMAEELEQWACVQKSPHAIQTTDIRMKRRMRKMGAVPDMWIFPEGLKTYITNVRQENFSYFIRGPDGPKMFQSGMSDGGQMLDVAMDCVIFEAKTFDVPEAPEPIDLMCRNQSIGEYVTLQNHLHGFTDWGKYSSRMRDIVVYNEEKDSWSTIGLEQCLHFCMRFGEPPASGHKRPRTDGGDDDDHRRPLDCQDGTDMFCTDDGKMAMYLGDMREWALNPRAVFDASSCLYDRIMRDAGDFNIIRHIQEGVKLCNEISSPDMDEYNKLINRPADDSATPKVTAVNDGITFTSDGFPDISAFGSTANGKIKLALTGLATYSGMKLIADKLAGGDDRETIKQTASNLVKAVDIIYERLQGISNSVFLSADYQQPWLKEADGRNTLFANLIFQPLQQLFLEKITGTTNGPVETTVTSQIPNMYAFNYEPISMTRDGSESGDIYTKFQKEVAKHLQTFDSEESYAKAAEMFKNAYMEILKSNDSPSQEELALIEQESILAINCLSRANVTFKGDSAGLAVNILTVIMIAKSLVKDGDQKSLDLIDLHRTLRYVFAASDSTDFVKRFNTFIGVTSMLYAIFEKPATLTEKELQEFNAEMNKTPDSIMHSIVHGSSGFLINKFFNPSLNKNSKIVDASNIGDYLKPDAAVKTVGGSATSMIATQLGVKFGHDKTGTYTINRGQANPRMFQSRLEADFTTPNGFGMENVSADQFQQSRTVGAQNDFNLFGGHAEDPVRSFKRRTFLDPSFGAGILGMQASERENMMNDDTDPAIKSPFSDTFKDRFKFYNSSNASPSELHRIIAQAYLGLPLTLGNLKKLIYTDIPFPFGFVCFRPYMTYRMGSGILAVKGASTGETLIGHANFMLGDDPVQKMHIGNFTMYEKSVIYKPHQVGIANNIFAMGYVGGNDCKFYSYQNQPNENRQGHIVASIFSCIIPYEGTSSSDGYLQSKSDFPNPMSITGNFKDGMLSVLEDDSSSLHYPTARFYSNFWHWISPADPDHTEKAYDVTNVLNTVCYQGHQQAYNPSTFQYDIVTTNTGHWGDRVYPGCGRVRRGVEKVLQPVSYAGSSTPYPSVSHLDY